ncbi:MAG: Lipid A biosynthesis lauroyltransferase [Alphaproteobacteria bacterium MarineAlpha6_Bin6]|nr:lauroyl acyltransferase [Pelagibacteraceae bacterium]PPR30608.1 MAG: Lipid A biosynthesis lauroyltransferase [Alphaproteobacteria bacterium MarineAlpha6_Bin6]PPR33566.1 MAG: Lipid A biosynthesis lauroyltransferase [Alphaproteobacteria bacterium MarineAlpha6_Bin5]
MYKLFKIFLYFIEGFLLLFLFIILKILPLNVSSFLMGKFASLIGPKLGVTKKAYNNIKKVMPEKNEQEIKNIIKDMWENLGKVLGEYPHLSKLDPEKNNKIQVYGKKNLLLIKRTKTPAIFFSGHLANWEISPIASIKNGVPVLSIFRRPNNPIVNFLIKYLRSNLPMAPKGKEGAKQLIYSLRKGRSIGLVIDQKMNDGIKVPFFNKPAMTSDALAQLCLRIKSLVVPVEVERIKNTNFKITFHNPLKIIKKGKKKTPLEIMTEVNLIMEKWIRKNPGQWLWLHKRW